MTEKIQITEEGTMIDRNIQTVNIVIMSFIILFSIGFIILLYKRYSSSLSAAKTTENAVIKVKMNEIADDSSGGMGIMISMIIYLCIIYGIYMYYYANGNLILPQGLFGATILQFAFFPLIMSWSVGYFKKKEFGVGIISLIIALSSTIIPVYFLYTLIYRACKHYTTLDAGCSDGEYWDYEERKCSPEKNIGGYCQENTQCLHGYCVDNVCQINPRSCKPSEFYNYYNNNCESERNDGQHCDKNHHCSSGLCTNNVCSPKSS